MSDSTSPCWDSCADVAQRPWRSVSSLMLPENQTNSYSMTVTVVTDPAHPWRFFSMKKVYDGDSMMYFWTLTDSYLWRFLGRLWQTDNVMYQHNPCSAFDVLRPDRCSTSGLSSQHATYICLAAGDEIDNPAGKGHNNKTYRHWIYRERTNMPPIYSRVTNISRENMVPKPKSPKGLMVFTQRSHQWRKK